MCDLYLLTIGDGFDNEKDLSRYVVKKGPACAVELRAMVFDAIGESFVDERAIEDADVDEDEDGLTLIVNEGPDGEVAPNAGPWLVARLALVGEV